MRVRQSADDDGMMESGYINCVETGSVASQGVKQM